MDKYESKLRIEEIEKLKKKKQYKEAARLADTIEWHRIKNAVTLYKVADLYKICRNYTECRNLLELAYERSPYAKNVIFALCDVCLEFGDFEAATEYYKEYVALAPKDPSVYILKYKMLKALEAGIDERIEILETLKRHDRIEEWEYELATLYHRAGMAEKCVEECDELILWFGEGSYVYKAMELKMLHEPLTPEQEMIYNRRLERKERVRTGNTGRIPKSQVKETPKEEVKTEPVREEEPEEDFHVKTINMGKFNTIDLQAELAANLKDYIGGEPSMVSRLPEEEPAEEVSVKSATGSFGDVRPDAGEVFFEDATGELMSRNARKESPVSDNTRLREFKEQYKQDMKGRELPKSLGRLTGEEEGRFETMPVAGGVVEEKVLKDGTVELIKEFQEVEPEVVVVGKDKVNGELSVKKSKTGPMRVIKTTGPMQYSEEDLLPNPEEKQISGQINIQDIMAEWENIKRQKELKMQEGLRKKTLENTGNMFAEFDKEANSGLLATLENPALINSVTAQSTSEDFIKGVSLEDMKKGKTAARTPEKSEELKIGKVIEAPPVPEETEEDPEEKMIRDILEEDEKEAAKIPETTEETEEEAAETVEVQVSEEVEETFEEENYEEETEEAPDEATVSESPAEESEEEETAQEESEEEVPEEEAEEAAVEENTKEKYHGSVTQEISGNIWDEVDNVQENAGNTEEVEEEESAATKVISREEIKEALKEEKEEAEESESGGNGDMSKEEKKIFAPFLYSKKMKQQIMETCECMTLAAYTGNVIITADGQESEVQLAKLFTKNLRSTDPNFTGGVAKIGAEKLNTKDVGDIFAKLVNGALIVTRAGKMTNSTINAVLQNLNQEARGVEVFLLDSKSEIRRLLERAPVLERFFNGRVDIIAMSPEMLAEYGRKYANDLGYEIDNMAMLAFSGRISELQIGTHLVSVEEVKELVQDAIDHADRKSVGKFTRTLTGKRYDDDHRVILREKDFEYRKK
ncbi:MAG: tetratricopeptide repeat protein [Lachnospiraceae bacterium]|nr:tetratricopeptide repeat protein [Lachnospiraceae bacterium]